MVEDQKDIGVVGLTKSARRISCSWPACLFKLWFLFFLKVLEVD